MSIGDDKFNDGDIGGGLLIAIGFALLAVSPALTLAFLLAIGGM